uniref:Uncharacterized protein n=1 Tax=Triticum urartu TaxID=4572 RepID=A0A8R7QF20_TRIUA
MRWSYLSPSGPPAPHLLPLPPGLQESPGRYGMAGAPQSTPPLPSRPAAGASPPRPPANRAEGLRPRTLRWLKAGDRARKSPLAGRSAAEENSFRRPILGSGSRKKSRP